MGVYRYNGGDTAELYGNICQGQSGSGGSTDLSNYPTKTEMNTALNAKQNKLSFDDQPTQGSQNPVKSAGIYSALRNKSQVSVQQTQTSGNEVGRITIDGNTTTFFSPDLQIKNFAGTIYIYETYEDAMAAYNNGEIPANVTVWTLD